MDLIQKMNIALDYIENHLEEEIDLQKVSSITNLTYYHFSRVFSAITDIGLSEYIRNRRLSEAARDIAFSDIKIIDVAYKYLYTTPESFSRAFKNFHKISPRQARSAKDSLVHFPKLVFNIQTLGDKAMRYKIIDKEEMHFVGILNRVKGKHHFFQSEKKHWKEFVEQGYIDKTREIMLGQFYVGCLYDVDIEKNEFSFLVGVQVQKPLKYEGLESITIPANRYIVFERLGPMPDSINKFKDQIFSDWFVNSETKILPVAEIEFYHFGNTIRSNEKFEYWISIP